MAGVAAAKGGRELLIVNGREVSISNPHKVLFPEAGYAKLDVVRYYMAVADGALRGAGGRPNVLVRYPNGIGQEFFYQKRAPESRPDWIEVVALKFPSGRTAEEVVPRDAAALAWMANLACLELHPHPVRAEDLDHPERQGSHRCVGLLRSSEARCACVRTVDLGRNRLVRSGRLYARNDARAVQGDWRSPHRHRQAPVFARSPAGAVGARSKGRSWRRAVAAAVQEAAGRADARAAVSR